MKTLFRKLLPPAVKHHIRHFFRNIDNLLVNSVLFKNNHAVSRLIYRNSHSRFNREMNAVLAGKVAYATQDGVGEDSSALLRRNIHRIEKGLSMRPRRSLFANDFIVETANCLMQCHQAQLKDREELHWATDVLVQYFNEVEVSDNVERAKAVFDSILQSYPLEQDSSESFLFEAQQKRSPYSQSNVIRSGVTFDSFQDLCKQRRSVRWFLSDPVADEDINRAIQAAALAPSACNRQPFRFYVANGAELATEIASYAGGTAGFAENIPCTIVVVGDLSCYPKEQDRHVIYIDSSLAAMQLMLGLETLGLSSCPINWPDLDVAEQRMAARLKLKPYERPIMLIAVGHPDPTGFIPYSQKKSVAILRKDLTK